MQCRYTDVSRRLFPMLWTGGGPSRRSGPGGRRPARRIPLDTHGPHRRGPVRAARPLPPADASPPASLIRLVERRANQFAATRAQSPPSRTPIPILTGAGRFRAFVAAVSTARPITAPLTNGGGRVIITAPLPNAPPGAERAEVAEWQTRRSQKPLGATSWGFDSPLRHPRHTRNANKKPLGL